MCEVGDECAVCVRVFLELTHKIISADSSQHSLHKLTEHSNSGLETHDQILSAIVLL